MYVHRLRTLFRPLPVIVILVAQVVLSPIADATPGDLDPTFGVGGKVTTDFAIGGSSDDQANAVAIQPDGKIVVAGTSFFVAPGPAPGRDVVLSRYNPDGSLDPSFGTGGKVATALGANQAGAEDMTLQADGKILVAGSTASPTGADFALARFNPDGSPDISFGTGGAVSTDLFGSDDSAEAVALQTDGKIVLAGVTHVLGATNQFGLVRYNPDGSLDTAFGVGGRATTDVGFVALDVAIQPSGKIVAAGQSTSDTYALARFTVDGSLDPSFGTGGTLQTNLGYATTYAVASQPDGRILAGGSSAIGSPTGAAVVRYLIDGTLDSSFGAGGVAVADFGGGSGVFRDISLLGDGKIVAVGGATAGVFAVARFSPDGTLDPSFGVGGRVTTDFADHAQQASAVAVQSNGNIVAAGARLNALGEDFAIARYQGVLTPPVPFISSFSPHSGPVGTSVTIAGVNFAGTTAVWFNNTTPSTFVVNATGTLITAVVPSGATSGPIRVTTPVGTATSVDSFIVTSNAHERHLTLSLHGHLVAEGSVVVTDGFAACFQNVYVKIQRHIFDHWRTIAADRSGADGSFSRWLPDWTGWYRAKVNEVTLSNGHVCNGAISGARHYRRSPSW